MELIFHFGDSFQAGAPQSTQPQPRLLLAGQITQPIQLHEPARSHVLGVRFLAGGALPFLRFPQHEVTGQIADLTCFWGDRARALHERLADAPTDAARVRLLDAHLASFGPSRTPNFDHLSPRQYRRRFEAAVGLPPKLHQRILRFQHALRLLESAPDCDAAVAAGYFDQSHLIRDFQSFAGMSPTAYRRRVADVLFVQDATAFSGLS